MKEKNSKKGVVFLIVIVVVMLLNAIPRVIAIISSYIGQNDVTNYSDLQIESVEVTEVEDTSSMVLAVDQKAYILTLTVINYGNRHEDLKYYPFSVNGVDGYASVSQEVYETNLGNLVDERIIPVGREITLDVPIVADATVTKVSIKTYYTPDNEKKEKIVSLDN